MNNHQHGAFGALRLKKVDNSFYDLTPHVDGFTSPKSVDMVEDTGLQPAGSTKTFLQGLRSATPGFTARLTPDGELMFIVEDILNKADRSGSVLQEFPFGMNVGAYAEELPVIFSDPGSLTSSNSTAVTASFACQASGPLVKGTWNGTVIVPNS